MKNWLLLKIFVCVYNSLSNREPMWGHKQVGRGGKDQSSILTDIILLTLFLCVYQVQKLLNFTEKKMKECYLEEQKEK